MEGLPLKYIAMIIASVIIIAALISIANMVASSATNTTISSGDTMSEILKISIGNVLNITHSP